MIDWTINFGHILSLLAMLATIMAYQYGLKADVKFLKHDMGSIQQRLEALTEAFKQLGNVLTQVAVQDTRLNMLEKKLDELRHGDGYVVNKDR